jgi:hypothetical protein
MVMVVYQEEMPKAVSNENLILHHFGNFMLDLLEGRRVVKGCRLEPSLSGSVVRYRLSNMRL